MRPPNILLIMDDQHRFDYLGCTGAGFVRTPNLDRLAEGGVRFAHCYSNAPVCAPARIALATGLQAHRFGGWDNGVFLPLSRRTYYQRLRDAGYRVGCVGKLDLAKPEGYNSDGARPSCFSWGFTHPLECEGKMHAGQGGEEPFGPYTAYLHEKGLLRKFRDDYARRRREGYALSAWNSVLGSEEVEDAYIGRRAVEWIEQVRDDFPWHLFVSFVGPHDPFDPPAAYAGRYGEAVMPPPAGGGLEGKAQRVRRRQVGGTQAQVRTCRRQYCALIELIDDQVGRILDALERRGLREHTCILFASDHGEMLGDHGLFAKSMAYDPSLRVPLLVSGPGIEGGRTSQALVELIDIHATICELAGLGAPEGVDARSFAPLLRGERREHRAEVLSSLGPFRCVRTQGWKYIDNVADAAELYHLEEDPAEVRNLAAEKPQVVRAMAQRLQQRWLEGQWRR